MSLRAALAEAGVPQAVIEREAARLPKAGARPRRQMEATSEGAAARLFLAMGTQWKTAGMSGVATGLDYPALAPTAALLGIEMSPRIFDDIRLMETEALAAMARQRRRP